MSKAYSVSVSRGEKAAARHDGRAYTPENADRALSRYNVDLLRCDNVAERVNDFFLPAVQRYNDKQKRADRKKSEDYYHALMDGSEGYGRGDAHELPVYEYVFQIGSRETNGVTDDSFDVEHWRELKKAGKMAEASKYAEAHYSHDKDREAMKEALNAVGRRFAAGECGSNFLPLYAYGHDDEPNGTYHLHVAFCPYVTGEKTGLDTRVSLRKALKAMGYSGNAKEGIFAWQRDMKAMITEEMESRGYQRQVMENEESRLPLDEFKAQQRKKEAEAQIAGLEQKAEELTKKNEKLEQMTDGPIPKVVYRKAQQRRDDADRAASEAEARRAEAEARRAEAEKQVQEAVQKAAEARQQAEASRDSLKQMKAEAGAIRRSVADTVTGAEKVRDYMEKMAAARTKPGDAALLKYLKVNKAPDGRSLYELYTEKAAEMTRRAAAKEYQSLDSVIADAQRRARKLPDISHIQRQRSDDEFSL